MKTINILLLLILSITTAKGQGIPGYNMSNYAGVSGVFLQPASIADSRYKVDVQLIGAGVSINNDFISVTRKWYTDKNQQAADWKIAGLVQANNSDSRKNLNINQELVFPSFMVSLGRTAGIAFTSRERFYFNVDHLNPELAKLAYEGFDVPALFNIKLKNDRFNINTMAWNEYGLSYAQVINNKGPITMKAGVTVKLMQGLGGAFFYARDLNYSWKNKDTLNLFQSKFGYGTSDNLQYSFEDGSINDYRRKYLSKTNMALGFDFGFVIEWRPNYKDYIYELDGEEGLYRKDKNKYKLKLGASLVDLGRIKFNRSQYSADFDANVNNWAVNEIKIDGSAPIKSFSDTLKNRFGYLPTDPTFSMTLPTALSIQADYNIHKSFYVSFTSYISPRFIKDESKVNAINYYSIAPRWDTKWFGVMMPLSLNGFGQVHLGTTLRLGVLVVGTSNIGAFLFQDKITGADAYMALKVPIFQRGPRDKDHDGVSNKKDKCPTVAGTWQTHGCPDKDGDGIADKDDQCPDEFGPKSTKGCPDADNDGIADKDDHCPDLAGTIEMNGCPDSDGDGIADDKDSCKNVPGPASNNGCPELKDRDHDGVPDIYDRCPDFPGAVDKGGCPDTDGDGVYDDQDECPKTPGPISNKGCPEVKKEDQQTAMKVRTNLEFEKNSAQIKPSSFAALDALAKVMQQHPEYRLTVDGYTDNIGSDEANKQLSSNRARAVQTYLKEKGINPSRIATEGHGKDNPVDTNDTDAGRQHNRRVEIQLKYE